MTDGETLFPEDEQNILGLAGLLALMPVAFGAAHANEAGRLSILEQRSMMHWTPSLITPSEAREMFRRRLLDAPAFGREMQRNGFSGDRASKMLALSRALIDPNSLAEATRRGLIDPDGMRDYLAILGYNETDADRLTQLRLYIPTAQDVVSFANRDVYYPDIVEKYGMALDFPEAMLPDMERAGLEKDTALKFWESHWQLPSMPLAFEMLQRDAETGLSAQDINRLMRSAGIEPYWRDKILAVSYSPFTRVDIRRMHKQGILNRDAVVRAYRDIGYNPYRAELLTQFTEKLNAGSQGDAATKMHAKLRTRVESLFEEGVFSAEQLRSTYVALGFDPMDADAFVAEAQFLQVASAQKDKRDAVKQAYVRGAFTPEAATARLAAIGYDDAEIQRVMDAWHSLRETRELTAREHAERDLTRADIIGAYNDAILTHEDAAQHLSALKYADDEVSLLLARADIAREKISRTAVEHGVHLAYVARRIARPAAISRLGDGNVQQSRIDSLIAEWDMEIDAKTPQLSVKNITDALVAGIIQQENAVTRIDAHGYTVDDRNILIALATKGVSNGQ